MELRGSLSSVTPAEGAATACVLAVDVDELTLGRTRAAVRGTEFTVAGVSREEALLRLRSEEGRVIVLLEWAVEDPAERAQLCEAMRRAARRGAFHVVALGGPADHAALLRATDGPANDALSRPFDSELLLVRLRQAVRAMRSEAAVITTEMAVGEALQHGSGEVCVRSGDTVARIHVNDGHIVWANVSSAPATMEAVVAHGGVTLEPDMIGAVKQECRATGAHFMDVLVQWGIIEPERAREAVRSFVTRQVEIILAMPEATALFLPSARPRQHSERLSFRASEILTLQVPKAPPIGNVLAEPPAPESRRAPALSLPALADIVQAAMETEGAIGAAVLERGTGTCLHHAGAEVDTQAAWSQVSALAALGPAAEEVLAAAGDLYFVTRTVRGAPSLALFVSLSASKTSLGLARAAIAGVAAQRGQSSESRRAGSPTE